MWFWKKKVTGEVIQHKDYEKLPDEHKEHFEKTEEKPTHTIAKKSDDDDNSSSGGGDDFMGNLVVLDMMGMI